MSHSSDIEILQKKSLLKDSRVFHRDYVNNRSLNPVAPNAPQVTHARSTTASYTNSAGLIASAAINEPRFDFEPDLRTNKLLYSQEFDNAAWTKTNATVTANVGTAPDSTNTAESVLETVATGEHRVLQAQTVTSGIPYTFSIYAKQNVGTRNLAAYGITGGQAWIAIVNLSTGALVSSSGQGGATGSATVTSVGSGWYRVAVTLLTTATTISVSAGLDSGVGSYAGDGVSSILIWGAQLETGAITPYQATPNALTPPRCKGLLIEESRTNLVTYSGNPFDASAHWAVTGSGGVVSTVALSPNGADYMSLFSETAVTNTHSIAAQGSATPSSIPVVSGTTYTGSVYLKRKNESVSWVQVTLGVGGFNLGSYANVNIATGEIGTYANLSSVPAMTNVGNGVWRATISAVATTTGNSNGIIVAFNTNINNATRLPAYLGAVTNEMYIWGGQLEAGSVVTSYIPTTSAAVTRGRDELSVGSSDCAKFVNSVEGTMLYSYDSAGVSTGTDNEICKLYADVNDNKYVINHGSYPVLFRLAANTTSPIMSSVLANTPYTVAAAYSDNLMRAARNGTYLQATTVGGRIYPTAMLFGTWFNGRVDKHQNGHVRKISYYNKALSPRLVKALSQTT